MGISNHRLRFGGLSREGHEVRPFYGRPEEKEATGNRGSSRRQGSPNNLCLFTLCLRMARISGEKLGENRRNMEAEKRFEENG